MPRNGSGVYSLPQAPFTAGTVISSAAVNSDLSDIASALTGSLPRDGQAGMTGQLKCPDGSTSVPTFSFTADPATGFSRGAAPNIAVSVAGVSVGTFSSAGWSGSVVGGTVSGNGAVPIGALLDFTGSAAPSFWLLCFGQAISRTTYSALFAVIGTTYGAGDGSTTFNLPDYRGRLSAGVDNMGGTPANRITSGGSGITGTTLGASGGAETETLTVAQLPTGITSSALNTMNSGANSVWQNTSGASIQLGGAGPAPGSISQVTVSGTITVTSTNTSGAAHVNVQPTIMINKIIYVGV